MPELSGFEVETAIETLQGHKSPGIDQIPAELIKAGGRTIHSVVHKLVNSLRNKQELPEEWGSRSLYLSIRRVIQQILEIIEPLLLQIHTKFYPASCCQV